MCTKKDETGGIMKKLTAILMAAILLFAFAGCNNETEQKTTTQTYSEQEITEDETVQSQETDSQPIPTVTVTDVNGEVQIVVEESTLALDADPTKWTDEEIVEFYKAAAIKSKTKVKSSEKKTLEEMVVNDGDGLLGTLVEWVTPYLTKTLAENSTEFDGITGGYENLEVSDTASVRSYKSGEYTVVEMTMKEQTDGIHADRYSGTVGHAISVVGDISSVEEALSLLEIDFENADIKLHYSDPKLKVKINKDGIIEKGTWTYTVDVTVANLHVAAVNFPIEATVESAYGSVGYVITVGGGF